MRGEIKLRRRNGTRYRPSSLLFICKLRANVHLKVFFPLIIFVRSFLSISYDFTFLSFWL